MKKIKRLAAISAAVIMISAMLAMPASAKYTVVKVCYSGNCSTQTVSMANLQNQLCRILGICGTNSGTTTQTVKPQQSTQQTTQQTTDNTTGNPVSGYAAQVLSLTNAERTKRGLKALSTNDALTALAQKRAVEQNAKFGHTRPDGSSYYSVLKSYSGSYRMSGENVAMGQRSPSEVVNAWMNSSGHRANILNTSFTAVGIGAEKCTVSGYAGYCWSQLFIG